jgi:hypothetical protein
MKVLAHAPRSRRLFQRGTAPQLAAKKNPHPRNLLNARFTPQQAADSSASRTSTQIDPACTRKYSPCPILKKHSLNSAHRTSSQAVQSAQKASRSARNFSPFVHARRPISALLENPLLGAPLLPVRQVGNDPGFSPEECRVRAPLKSIFSEPIVPARHLAEMP